MNDLLNPLQSKQDRVARGATRLAIPKARFMLDPTGRLHLQQKQNSIATA
jgi:hypothetical protein